MKLKSPPVKVTKKATTKSAVEMTLSVEGGKIVFWTGKVAAHKEVTAEDRQPRGNSSFSFIFCAEGEEAKYKKILRNYMRERISEDLILLKKLMKSIDTL